MILTITFILPYLDCLKNNKTRTIDFFKMMNEHLNSTPNLQLIVSDYGSTDGIKEYLEKYFPAFDYVYVEPNEGQLFNISKCYNKAFLIAKKTLIFTCSIDWRFDPELIRFVLEMFKMYENLILEVQINVLDEKGEKVIKVIHTSVFDRKFIQLCRGWDERIYNWGQEDHDVINSCFSLFDATVVRVSRKHIGLYHLWHDNVLYKDGGGKERNELNMEIGMDNLKNERKNAINSYW